MNNLEGISVVIITHNELPYLKLCLDHLARHSVLNNEYLLVIDSSSDGTTEWVKTEGIRLLPTLRYECVNFAEPYRAWSHGLEMATRNNICFICNDELACPKWDEEVMKLKNDNNFVLMSFISPPQLFPGTLDRPEIGRYFVDCGTRWDNYDEKKFHEALQKFSSDETWGTGGESHSLPHGLYLCTRKDAIGVGGFVVDGCYYPTTCDSFFIDRLLAFRSVICTKKTYFYHFGHKSIISRDEDYPYIWMGGSEYKQSQIKHSPTYMRISDIYKYPHWQKMIKQLSEIQDSVGVIPRYHDFKSPDPELLESTPDALVDSHLEYWRNWEYPFVWYGSEPRRGMTVCDLGPGNSPLLAWATKYRNADSYGLETTDEGQNEYNNVYLPGRRFHPLYTEKYGVKYTVLQGGFLNPNICSMWHKKFDRVFSCGVLEHIGKNSVTEAFIHMREILKDDGIVALTFDVGHGVLHEGCCEPIEFVKNEGWLASVGFEWLREPDWSRKIENTNWARGTIYGVLLKKKNT